MEEKGGSDFKAGFIRSLINSGLIIRIAKIILLAVFFLGVLYFIYSRTSESNGQFIIASSEIRGDTVQTRTDFKKDTRIYFKYLNKSGEINGSLLTFKIEKFYNNGYHHFKQVTYEIEKSYREIEGYFPVAYFSSVGKYRIKVNLDGNTVIKTELIIE